MNRKKVKVSINGTIYWMGATKMGYASNCSDGRVYGRFRIVGFIVRSRSIYGLPVSLYTQQNFMGPIMWTVSVNDFIMRCIENIIYIKASSLLTVYTQVAENGIQRLLSRIQHIRSTANVSLLAGFDDLREDLN